MRLSLILFFNRWARGATLIIVVIHWMIKPDKASLAAFQEYWSKSEPSDRSHLVGEFLSEPLTAEVVGFPCLTFDAAEEYVSFFNVGLWESLRAFREVIIDPMVGTNPITQDFEYKHRERMILGPQQLRIGRGRLPERDNLL